MDNTLSHTNETTALRERWVRLIHDLQDNICASLESADGKARFIQDEWTRKPDGNGGGGLTRVISNGNIFEKGGVNSSVVFGNVTDIMRKQLNIDAEKWFACGVSIVIHPSNPFVPTIHCNYRMFELYDEEDKLCDRWFGGGTDLTPYYLFEEDAIHFHSTYKNICDSFDPDFYAGMKEACDNYFVNTHRNNEPRGIGGIFYDHKRPDGKHDTESWFNFGKACGEAFTKAYLPIVEKRKDMPYAGNHKYWQEIRRGRYVEFNLVHDRGTLFGLKTNGRTESILMSLPPTVRFDYNYQPSPGSDEAALLEYLKPRDWTNK